LREAILNKILKKTAADKNHQVVSVSSNEDAQYMKKPCQTCPWRKDAVGVFPAEAFRISANTSYDMSERTFGCHTTGVERPKTCAGFLLKGSAHNLSVRLGLMKGIYDLDKVSDNGLDLFPNYKSMAVANGVSPDDDSLARSRTDV
tara:strand:+ start:78 stop:515 length:438 start_codon:yes stop_codon:yes gene_type:complete